MCLYKLKPYLMKIITIVLTLFLSYTSLSQNFEIKFANRVDPFLNPELHKIKLIDSNIVDGLLKVYDESIEIFDCGNLAKSVQWGCNSLRNITGLTFEGGVESKLTGNSIDSSGYFKTLIIQPYAEDQKISHILKFTSGYKSVPEEWLIGFLGLNIK